MPAARVRLPAPPSVPDEVLAAFDVRSPGPPVRPAGADSEHFPCTDASGTAHLLRFDRYVGRPVDAVAGWCQDMSGAGLPVPAPRRAASGAAVVHAGGDWSCWQRVPGSHPPATGPSARRAGAALGALHASGTLQGRTDLPVPSLLRWTSGLGPADRDRLDALLCGPTSLAHLDAHRSNLVDDGTTMWVIDWVDAGAGTAELDAAVGAAYWAADGGPPCASAFAGGFASVTGVHVDDGAVATCVALLLVRSTACGSANVDRLATALARYRRR